jgi:hypothetical protein
MMADKGVSFEAQLFDIHPKITTEKDGRVKKWLELKLQTTEYDPRLLQRLIDQHGGMCSVSIDICYVPEAVRFFAKLQLELSLGKGKKAGTRA